MKSFLRKILTKSNLFFRTKKIKNKGCYLRCFRPCYISISKSAIIKTVGEMKFNISLYSVREKFEKGILICGENSNLEFGNNTYFRTGCRLICRPNCSFKIGENCLVNSNTYIECCKGIKIGNNVLISRNVTIIDSDSHVIEGNEISKEIIVGNNVWIGTNCLVLKGVNIGEGSIIGAGSVVVHDVPPRCMVAGNPAVIKRRDVVWKRG